MPTTPAGEDGAAEPGFSPAAAMLLRDIERVERLEEEIAGIKEEVKAVFANAKSRGFDPKAMRQMIRERKMEPRDRQDWLSLLELYRTGLGLTGTPLGDAARRRFDPPASSPPPPDHPGGAQDGQDGQDAQDPPLPFDPTPAQAAPPADPAAPEAPAPSAPSAPTEQDVAAAKDQGMADAEAGKRITENPFPAMDLRRAAWDEGWCLSSGSDGMELPAAWRRRKPDPKGKGAAGASAGDAQ